VSSSLGSRRLTKRIDLEDLLVRCRSFGERDRPVVLTNGCFDLLHFGHIHTITESAKLGTLVVALNSDASIRRLKGDGRPVDDLDRRAQKLTQLGNIDYIVVFEEDTPRALIERLKPDVLVKGGDYALDEIVGRELVESYGGSVTTVSYLEGHSTSAQLNNPE
jgi:D-beta-D-heptose 7-phosphate kinase / D-beta-D-heptose 1-phosphate adenosyltransferase